MSGYGLAKEIQLEILIDITNAMLQNRQYTLSLHQMQLTKIPSLPYLQLINQFIEQHQIQEHQLIAFQHIQQLPSNIAKTAKIKVYCQLITSAICQNHNFNAQKYTTQLLEVVQDKSDLQKATYFLFGVSSLLKLKYYEPELNKQYRYDLNTQALLYYILSILKPQAATQYANKFNVLYEEITQDQLSSRLLKAVYQSLNSNDNTLIQQLIKRIVQQEVVFSKMENSEGKTHEQLMKKVDKVIDEKKVGNRKLIQVLNLLKVTQKYPFFKLIVKDLQQTKLLKKVFEEKSIENPKKQAQKQLQLYKKRQVAFGLGDVVNFKRCQVGMSILKYNFGNSEVGWRYVKIGQDGIYWGRESSKCSFKYSWDIVEGLVYGKATRNLMEKCKYISSDHIFSLILKERSVDFICQNEEEVISWLQGLCYILNKHWSHKKLKNQEKKIVITKGSIYWKRLFMKLSVESGSLMNKSSGIILKESVVKYKLKERGSQI